MPKGLTDGQINLISQGEVKTRMLLTFNFSNNLLDLELEDGLGILRLETSDKLKQETDYIYLLENDTLTSLTVDDKVYLASMIRRSNIDTKLEGGTQKVNITLSNIDQVYSSMLATYGDTLTNSKCTIEEVIFKPPTHDNLFLEGGTSDLLLESGDDLLLQNNYIIDDKINIFEGLINNISVSDTQFNFSVERTLGGYSTQSPNTTYDISCQFSFKDTRCQYSGTYTTCDKTLTACQARTNSDRFGGYPSVPVGLKTRF